jgi:hypothetical protein
MFNRVLYAYEHYLVPSGSRAELVLFDISLPRADRKPRFGPFPVVFAHTDL